MTHPFHPLHGREFPLVEIKPTMGVERVHYTGDDGVVRSIRRAWTSVACEDSFVRVGSGRSAFRVSDLLALASLLAGLDGDDGAGKEAEGGAGTVKGIFPNVQKCFLRMTGGGGASRRPRRGKEWRICRTFPRVLGNGQEEED